MLQNHYIEGLMRTSLLDLKVPKMFLLKTCKLGQHYFIPLLLKAIMYFVNTTNGFLPLLLSDYSLPYISVEKISILIVR